MSILAEPPVTVVDKNVDKHGTREVATAYLQYLYTDEAQEIAAKNHYRPRLASGRSPSYEKRLPQARAVHGRRGLRWLAEGTEDALRRQWHLRPDLRCRAVADDRGRRGARAHRHAATPWRRSLRKLLGKPRVLPGLVAHARASRCFYLSALVLLPIAALMLSASTLSWAQIARHRHARRAPSPRSGSRSARRFARGPHQHAGGHPGGVGARALPLLGPHAARRHRRPALRAAHLGGRHRAHLRVLGARLDRLPTLASSACPSRSRASASSSHSPSWACRSWCARCSRSIQEIDAQLEEAAASLGATKLQTFRRVHLAAARRRPSVPALRSRSRARSASTARCCSSPATCR